MAISRQQVARSDTLARRRRRLADGRRLACGCRAWHRRRGRRRRLQSRIDPARMDAAVQAIGRLRIDGVGVQYQAPERRLDVSAGTAEPVVEIEMAEGGIEIVTPQQADDPAAEP